MARLLIVDDSSFLRNMVAKPLKEAGHEVLEAVDGVDGLKKIASESPDCVLLDLAMPQLGGLEVLQVLQDNGTGVPVIVVTADVQDDTRRQCLALGAQVVINKPSSPNELNQAIQDVLNARPEVGQCN